MAEMFKSVLVANRGEIAVRVIRTLRRLGIRAIAVYGSGDEDARHVREADVALRLSPAGGPAVAAPGGGYLDIDAVVAAAVASGAEAVHPGYGFLAENAAFARAVAAAGPVFVGPPPDAIELMGDKISAKVAAEKAGVPVVPGLHRPGLTDADLLDAAAEVGFPVLLKPSAGGGGKGMRRVAGPAELPEAVAAARREALTAFGDDALLLERYVADPRHIEIQVLADAHGGLVHLGERECSLQRRHQKIIEEAPSPLLSAEQRDRMGAAAVEVARACGYTGAGTVEFIMSAGRPEDFFFMEMNTRLQVEHPVTELVTGLDLVEEQLRCAAGEPLRLQQADIVLTGHAVEARIYAEDPARDFLPTGGRVLVFQEPAGDHVRLDSGIEAGTRIGTGYDPMLAKVVAWGAHRDAAVHRLEEALARTVLLGVPTNLAFLRALLRDPDVASGRLDTGLVERRLEQLVDRVPPHDAVIAAALGRLAARRERAGSDPFDVLTGWRIGGRAWIHERLQVAGAAVDVAVRGEPDDAEVRLDDGPPIPARARRDGTALTVTVGSRTSTWSYAEDGDAVWVGFAGAAWSLREVPPRPRRDDDTGPVSGPLVSPMPGTVTAVQVAEGDRVEPGQAVAVVEAMKMEHVVRATAAGRVSRVLVKPGQSVALEAPLVTVDGVVRDEVER